MTKVKVCGITNLKDALAASDFGADAIGFNFNPASPRYITKELAKEIIEQMPEEIKSVGLFVNENPNVIMEVANFTNIDILQLHAVEAPDFCSKYAGPVVKAIRMGDRSELKTMVDFHVNYYLLASPAATPANATTIFDSRYANEASKYGMVILAGGLTPENVAEAIRSIRPYGVDVCSSIEEEPGKKDHKKMKKFIKEAKSA